MEAAVIAQLLAQFGPSAITLIDQLIVMVENKATLTAADWAKLRTTIVLPSMAALQRVADALGKTMEDPQIAALASLLPKGV